MWSAIWPGMALCRSCHLFTAWQADGIVADACGIRQQRLCQPLFGNTPPFETRLRSSSACIVRNCTNI
jgi:hypothetical protein